MGTEATDGSGLELDRRPHPGVREANTARLPRVEVSEAPTRELAPESRPPADPSTLVSVTQLLTGALGLLLLAQLLLPSVLPSLTGLLVHLLRGERVGWLSWVLAALPWAMTAGVLGLAHTWPSVNKWTHGTLITPMHGHAAFFGAYAMIVLAVITYAMPAFNGRDESEESALGLWAFWLMIAGMFGMTMAFAAAGITQTYLERILGLGYLDTQLKIQVHFLMLVGTGILFATGAACFLIEFFRYPMRPQLAAEVPAGAGAGARARR
jgi:heme/copper-type cytochrome/quinol oxidase subunit 1